MEKRNAFIQVMKVGCLGLICFFSPWMLSGQSCTENRYIDSLFVVERTGNELYAQPKGIFYPPYVAETLTNTKSLEFDWYEPLGDTLSKRPLIIMAFGGAFLVGTKRQSQLVDFCEALAARGFAVASIEYRLGYNILNENSAIRAVYRATQDINTAIRYFKGQAETYRIDTSLIFTGGNSAGSIASLHAAFLEETERESEVMLRSTYGLERPLGVDWPGLGCLDCSGEMEDFLYQGPSEAKALINLWGALSNGNFIHSPADQPVISFYGEEDRTVQPDVGPPLQDFGRLATLYGSIPIHRKLDSLGIFNEVYNFPGEGHELWNKAEHAVFIQEKTAAFLFQLIQPQAAEINGSDTALIQSVQTYSLIGAPNSTFCWEVDGGEVISLDTSANQVDILWTRAGQGLVRVRETNCNLAAGPWNELLVEIDESINSEQSPKTPASRLYPNPVGATLWVETKEQTGQLRIFSTKGQLFHQQPIEKPKTTIDLSFLPGGFYILQLQSVDGQPEICKIIKR